MAMVAQVLSDVGFEGERMGDTCVCITALANANGGYAVTKPPEWVNVVVLVVFKADKFNQCYQIAKEIAQRLGWSVHPVDDEWWAESHPN